MRPREYICLTNAAVLASMFFTARPACAQEAAAEEFSMTFSGTALGGNLILYQMPEGENLQQSLTIVTVPGEDAASVVQRISTELSQRDPFGWRRSDLLGTALPHAAGATLQHLPGGQDGMLLLAGDETGLGIPEPPKSLTVRYDAAQDQIILCWQNPAGAYDGIAIVWNGWGLGALPGNTARFVHDRRASGPGKRPEGLNVAVVGYRSGVPSAAASIRLDRAVQEEAVGLPFRRGIAPNWTSWTTDNQAPKFEENKRPEKVRGKSFYQRIKSKKAGEQVGVWRKFLGLVPGHTYKLSVWVCTDAMDDSQGDWSFSLHAAPDAPDGKDFTVDQYAGRAPLPAGGRGPQAGAFAAYRRGVTTTRKEFGRASTDPQDNSPGREIGHITLPPNVTSITVWVRYSSSDPNASGVAFDHLRLEDLTQQ